MKKKLLAALSAFVAGLMAFADGEATPILDTTAVQSVATQLKTDIGNWTTAILPIMAGIAGAFLGFWLLKLLIRGVRSFGRAG